MKLPHEINWCKSALSAVMNGSVVVVASRRPGVVNLPWLDA